MKNRTLLLLLLVAGIFMPVMAQQEMQPLPIDPEGEIWEAYQRINLLHPAQRTAFQRKSRLHIAQRVGSMQEEDSQAGLAHFLEHMAFNGSKNFPNHGIDDFT